MSTARPAKDHEVNYSSLKDWQNVEFGKHSLEEASYYRKELKKAGVESLHGVRVLELGFGNGEFGSFAIKEGADYHGVDTDNTLLEKAKIAGWNVDDQLHNSKKPYDIVYAFDVLEHMDLDEQLETLRRLSALMKPGGLLLIRMPSGDSPFATYVINGDITHRKIHGSESFRQLAKLAGLSVRFVAEPEVSYGGLSVTHKFVRFTKTIIRAALNAGVRSVLMCGPRKAVLTPTMVACLVKP